MGDHSQTESHTVKELKGRKLRKTKIALRSTSLILVPTSKL